MGNHKTKLITDNRGMASIFITMIIMIVLGLIVLGFTQISQREQRVTTDRQLSLQAFYAAESGVNDAISAIKNNYLTVAPAGKTNCGADTTSGTPFDSTHWGTVNVLNATNGVAYTCLTINPFTHQLNYSDVGTDQSTIIPFQVVNSSGTPTAPGNITISWENNANGANTTNYTNCQSLDNFVPNGSWDSTHCGASILRLDIVPGAALDGTSGTRNNLLSQTMTMFLQPQNTGTTTVVYAPNQPPQVVGIHCQNPALPYECRADISGIGSGQYYIRVRSLYAHSKLAMMASLLPDDYSLYLKGAEITIDSTGKANDVLRRIQVQVPSTTAGNQAPEFAIQSTNSICKRFSITNPGPGSTPVRALPGGLPGNEDTSSCFP